MTGSPDDIGYCILRQEPNVQPIPLAMHCEVEAFLGAGTPVTAVGFGRVEPQTNTGSGVKRMATASLTTPVSSGQGTFSIGQGWTPGNPAKGDSGGPLLVALPDGTWRVIGIASSSFVVYVSPWLHLEWILEDPNVVQAEILPCHTPQGEWSPGPGCGGFPVSPGTPAGSWGRGPRACFDAEVGGPSQTCGPPGEGGSGGVDESGSTPTMGVVGGDDGERSQTQAPTETRSGCRCSAASGGMGGRSWVMFAAFFVLGACLRSRRTRRGRTTACGLALVAMMALLCGCPGNQGGTTGAGADTAEDGGVLPPGPPPGPPPIDPNNPGYQGILGGIDPDPSVDYHDLAVGNVSRAVSSSACCQDYVIASPSTSVVRVLFSADLPGVTFLADTPDELVDVGGPGVDDVLLADLDGDDRNDLVALRSDGNVAVVRGVAGPPAGPFFDAETVATFPAGAGAGAMTATDLDCDGDLDLAITAPSTDAFVLLAGGGNGTFSIPLPKPAGSAPQDIATGDVDGDGDHDVAVSNDDGGFSVALNQCNGFAAPVSYEIYPTATPQIPIAMGKLCPGHPNDVAVAVGILDIVYLTCGDGSGSFANVVEPHGEQVVAPYDYFWDSQPGYPTNHLLADLFVWDDVPTLYALRLRDSTALDTSEIVWLPPNPASLASGLGRPVVTLYGGESFSEAIAHVSAPGRGGWNQLDFVGPPGIGVSK